MTLSPEQRNAFLEILPLLGPASDRTPVVAFVRDNWQACIAELGASPGFDQVRAGLLRVMPDLLDDPAPIEAARARLEEYVEPQADRTWLLRRHPAWVGLARLELDGDVDAAMASAAAGFAKLTGAVGDGEVLWAMAEQADEAGWTDRSLQLLQRALDAPFHDAERGEEVRLLLGLRLAEDHRRDEALSVLADLDAANDVRTRIHARWVRAALLQELGRPADAQGVLEEALAEAHTTDDDGIVGRIQAAIDTLSNVH